MDVTAFISTLGGKEGNSVHKFNAPHYKAIVWNVKAGGISTSYWKKRKIKPQIFSISSHRDVYKYYIWWNILIMNSFEA